MIILSPTLCSGETHPRIGVALSGGGARGFAHIGVLKVLEEEGLQARIVTGTSMGSIIGGLYSAGYSPAFLEKMANDADWFDMFRETVDRKYIPMRRKTFRDRYLAAFPAYDGSVRLPSGLIKGQKIHRMLYRLCWPVMRINDFSGLPRSFACVATDMATGEPYVIDEGNLADAMRASMAIPTAFVPVERDGRLLADGGLVRNLPTTDAYDLGADMVICIDVSSELVGADSLRTMLDITDQTFDILMKSTLDEQRHRCDIYIRPDLPDVNTLDFSNVQDIIDMGEKAAREHIDQIRSLVNRAGGPVEPPDQMNEIPAQPVKIEMLRIEGLSEVPSSLVRRLLGIRPPASVTSADIDEALQKLYSTGYFIRISYSLKEESSGTVLVLDIVEEEQDYIGLGLRYDTRWSFSALLGAEVRNLIGRGSVLNIDMVLSRRVNILGIYTFDAGLGSWLAPGLSGSYVDDYIETYSDGTRTSRWGVRAGRALLLTETSLAYLFRFILSTGGEWYGVRPDIAPAGTGSQSGGLFLVGGDIWIDTLDRSWMPRRGLLMRLSGQYFPEMSTNDLSYGRIYGHAVASVPVHRRLSLSGRFLYGATGGGEPLPHHRYPIGGIMSWFDYYGERDASFYGYLPFELAGANAYIAGADILVGISNRWTIAGHFNAGAAVEDRSDVFSKERTVTGWGGTVALETPVGPAELKVSGSRSRNLLVWFGFGYRF
jgi:NTE family protein